MNTQKEKMSSKTGYMLQLSCVAIAGFFAGGLVSATFSLLKHHSNPVAVKKCGWLGCFSGAAAAVCTFRDKTKKPPSSTERNELNCLFRSGFVGLGVAFMDALFFPPSIKTMGLENKTSDYVFIVPALAAGNMVGSYLFPKAQKPSQPKEISFTPSRDCSYSRNL